MESLKWRLYRINDGIAKRDVIFLRAADGVFLAEPTDADGDVRFWGCLGHELQDSWMRAPQCEPGYSHEISIIRCYVREIIGISKCSDIRIFRK